MLQIRTIMSYTIHVRKSQIQNPPYFINIP